MNEINKIKSWVIFSAGGTGGHIFPALAVAERLRESHPDIGILFIGNKNRMEADIIPDHNFPIILLDMHGVDRKNLLKNINLPYKLLKSWMELNKIFKRFKPKVAVGFGGYVTYPVLKFAQWRGIPTIVQEQNSTPGLANIKLSKKASAICVAYPTIKNYIKTPNVHLIGNLVRNEITTPMTKEQAANFWNLNENKKTILALGGSLGAKAINDFICDILPDLITKDLQLIWQTGDKYSLDTCINKDKINNNIIAKPFINTMREAYAMADIVIARAGASTLAELAALAKPAIIIPSPNVVNNHQYLNAQALAESNAIILLEENILNTNGKNIVMDLINNESLQKQLSENISKFHNPNAMDNIIALIEKYLKN
jgi:UDP-N-acetylglucosamine--N-acetylmuramyl-(pentapeptide) pyrophosphoryl-undecaprenol N-acetylglucosamine transferase